MGNLPFLISALVLISSGLICAQIEQCDRYDPTSCPVSNGFAQTCTCQPFGGGCWCGCPTESYMWERECYPKPGEIGAPCTSTATCSLLPNTRCHPDNGVCACNPDYYPADDAKSCLLKPVQLGDSCSMEANCDALEGTICAGGSNSCECAEGLLPNWERTMCTKKAGKVGDICSDLNPCDDIAASDCVSSGEGETSCQCSEKYVPSQPHEERCVPTKIGLRCWEGGASCENIRGASCFGREEESICLCLWNVPTIDLTGCETA
ncbi:platelet endothelial aggregation receptor 1 [Folsomia candida]|uniref:Multiple epidermal growth factor-like domains protein 11 n=1 Tax=Folsomia candida TaxID=158441 RepID=A0A226DUN2_FOLCA|nr:platelet endothelial aggregation receptor 1 [Folsomia candida]OXA48728.1 Multiple epidermal growth factor-like domains protein 11 [Folsomia candida]